MVVAASRRLFTTEEYHTMLEAGILGEDDRVELIEGEILEMTPIGSRHAGGVKRLTALFSERLRGRAVIGVQDPVRLDDLSEPQPDISVLRPRADFYASGHPTPADVLLLVEVAEGSLDFDRRLKACLYAAAGIPELWVWDLAGNALEVHRDTGPDGYRDVRRLRRGDQVSPLAFPDLVLDVESLLGPEPS